MYSHICRIAVLAALLTNMHAAEPANRAPRDESQYLQVPAWFAPLPGEEHRHLAPAAVITAIRAGSPASAAGLVVNDRLIALDGRRVHDEREIRLLRSAMSFCHDQEIWTVERGQERLTLTLSGLDPFRITGATLAPPADDPDLVALLAPLGLEPSATDAQALRWLPARISHAVADWLASPSGARNLREAPWISEWIATYLHVLRGEAITAATMPVPEPFLAAVDRFHRAIAARRATATPDAPDSDPAQLGFDPWFCALFYPYPAGAAPDFGTPALSAPLVALLRKLYDDPLGCRPQGHYAARHLPRPKMPTDSEYLLYLVSCALIEPSVLDHIGSPVYLDEVPNWDPAGRETMLTELKRRIDARSEDADLAGVALSVALVKLGRGDEAMQAAAALGARSPWLAWRTRMLGMQVARWARAEKELAILKADARLHPYAESAPYPEIYQHCLDRCPTLALLAGDCSAEPGHGLPAVFRARPDLVAAALDRFGGRRENDGWSTGDSCLRWMNNAAWRIATRQPWADGELALQAARMILSSTQGGTYLDLDTKDTVAACLARGGDFAQAVRIEQEAIADLPPLWPAQVADFSKRLALYQAGQPADEAGGPEDPIGALVEEHLNWPHGQPRAQGRTCAGQRIGRWRFFSESGALEATCTYWHGQVDGPCRSYFPDGTMATEGFFADGSKRVGRWRAWHENGMLAIDAPYIIDYRNQAKCGEWLWYDPGGRRSESGWCSYNQREGHWTTWDLAGKATSRCDFYTGTPQPAENWKGTPIVTEPISPEPAPTTAAEFLARAIARHAIYEMDGTLSDYTNAIALEPDLAAAWAGRARAHEDSADHAGALSDANRAIALGATDASTYRTRAKALAGTGDQAGAIRDFSQALAVAPDDEVALKGRGKSHDAAGDHTLAIADLTAAIAMKPDDAEAFFSRAKARRAAGQLADASDDFTRVLALVPTYYTASYQLAEVKEGLGDRTGALAVLNSYIALVPRDQEAFYRRGLLQQAMGVTDGALTDWGHCIATWPHDRAAYQARGALLADLGRSQEALADLHKVLDLVPPDRTSVDTARLRIWLVRSRSGDGAAALRELKDFVANRQPGDAPDWLLAVLRYAAGQLGDAEVLTAALGKDPGSDSAYSCTAHFYIGAKHLLAGEESMAAMHFKAAVASGRRELSEFRSAEAELARLAQKEK